MAQKRIDIGVRRLIDAAVSSTLTHEEFRRLDEALGADPAVLDVFLKYCQLETDLFFHTRAMLVAERVASEIASNDVRPSTNRLSPAGPVLRRLRFVKSRWFSAIAASIMLGFCSWWTISAWGEIRAERQPEPIARYLEGEGDVWLGDIVPTTGHDFVEGDSVYLTKGRARISMAGGAELMLRAPCLVTLTAADRVQLEEGVVTAEVAEWGHGFTVATEALCAVDLGTKFAVSADSEGVAEAHVLNGRVRVQPAAATADDRRSLLLSGGEALRVESQRKLATRLVADLRLDAEMGDRPPFKPIAIRNTGAGLVEGDEDPNWRVSAKSASAPGTTPVFAVVCNADSRYLRNDPRSSQWISVCNPVRPGVAPNSEFTFETTFELSGYDLTTVMVAAQVIADNGVKAVRINGQPVAMSAWELNERNQTFNKFQLVEIKRGFVAGVNRIEFDVHNGIDQYFPAAPNPMSLRIEWQAFGRPLEPVPLPKASI